MITVNMKVSQLPFADSRQDIEHNVGQQPSTNDTLMRLDGEWVPWVTVNKDKLHPLFYAFFTYLLSACSL